MNDFIPKQKKTVPVELIDDAFENAVAGVEVWFVKDGKAVIHGTILPLPAGKDGNRAADCYTHDNTRRSIIGKEAHVSISDILLAHGLNPADYLCPAHDYWGNYYCFIAGEEDITKNVIGCFVLDRVSEIKNGTPRTAQ